MTSEFNFLVKVEGTMKFRLGGRPAPSSVPDLFHETRGRVLEDLKGIAILLCKDQGSATVEDVRHTYVKVRGEWPTYINPNIMSAVFKGPNFINMGYEKGTRTTSNQRPICRWRLK